MKTLPKQTSLFTEETLTSLREDSRVSHSVQQEIEKEQRTLGTFGRKCSVLYEKFAPVGSLERTFMDLLVGMEDWYSTRCALTWRMKASKSSRLYCQLQASTLHTSETESSLLLKTPCAMDAYSSNLKKKEQKFGNSGTLAQEVTTGFINKRIPGLLPTPTTTDYKGAYTKNSMVSKDGIDRSSLLRNIGHMADTNYTGGKDGQLNPLFVAEMMSFPPDWTISPFLNGESNQSKDMEMQ